MIRSGLGYAAAVVVLLGAIVLVAVPAGAQDDPEPPVTTTTFQISTPPPVSSLPPSTTSSVPVAVLPAQEVNDAGRGELAYTGVDPASLATIGVAAVAAGGVLVGAGRRRR